MKVLITVLSTSVLMGLGIRPSDGISVTRSATDKQIESAEIQSFKEFGLKFDIQVLSRNSDGNITNLKCICYDKSNRQSASCESDNFGLLVIKKDGGCEISDQRTGNKKQ